MIVHLVDGTYELFRHHFGAPERTAPDGREVGAVFGVLQSMMSLGQPGDVIGVATDHVIESFRNELYEGYKTGEGIDPILFAQFPILEEGLTALGVRVWPMVEFEADDALAAAACVAKQAGATAIRIYTPDKDLAQCVGGIVVQVDRRNDRVIDAQGVFAKFGVQPASIPDYLALVGDSADGFPGLSGWGAKSASTLLAEYGHLEHIPDDASDWSVKVRSSERLASTLREQRSQAELFRTLATLRTDAPVGALSDWIWKFDEEQFATWAIPMGFESLVKRMQRGLRG